VTKQKIKLLHLAALSYLSQYETRLTRQPIKPLLYRHDKKDYIRFPY